MEMTDKIKKARQFAIEKHGNQQYGNDPYIVHLDLVYEVAQHYGFGELIGICSYLHDVLEDTSCTFEELWQEFGWEVAYLVFLVTDETGQNRSERKQKTYEKTILDSRAVVIKLCDRIANVRSSKKDNNKLFRMYKKEHESFTIGLKLNVRTGYVNNLVNELNKLFE